MTNGTCTKCGESFAKCYSAWSCFENRANKAKTTKPSDTDHEFFMAMVTMHGGKPTAGDSK